MTSSEYRAKAWECLSLAEDANDPERRADLLRFGRDVDEPRGAGKDRTPGCV